MDVPGSFSGQQVLWHFQWQIVYAVLFIVGVHEFDVIRIFAWQMVHRHSLKRDLKRLELRLAELSETLKAGL